MDDDKYIVNLFNYYVSDRLNEKYKNKISNEIISEYNYDYPDEKLIKDKNREYNRFDILTDFINNYKTKNTSYLDYRLDKPIINTIKLHDHIMDKINTNILITFSNVEVGFSFEPNLLADLTKLLYNSECQIILCFYYDEEKYNNDKNYKEKLKCFKKLIWQNVISGKIFLVKSYHCIKFILDSMNFHQFNYLDYLKLNEFIDILDIDSI